jgi:5-methyltetrahydrofolate--homocysteine methyltransferase
VERVLDPVLPGRVAACRDAFAGVRALESAGGPSFKPRAAAGGARGPARPAPAPRKTASPIAPPAAPAFEPRRLGAFEIGPLGLGELLGALDRKTLFGPRWGYGRGDFPAAERELDELSRRLGESGFPGARALGGFYRCRRSGAASIEVEDPAGGAPERFDFPVEAAPPRRCLAQYFSEGGDAMALLAASVAPELAREAGRLRDEGRIEEYWRLHGLGSALAEAAAELAHAALSREMEAWGSLCPGRRYSFGFPACPGVERQGGILSLLGADRIGLALTSGFQLSPEHSVTAFVVARPNAEYFSV